MSQVFSEHGAEYRVYRTGYPVKLLARVSSYCAKRDLAWDVATGTGQVAQHLTSHFTTVIASDLHHTQLDHAIKLPNMSYVLADALSVPLKDGVVDLCTVGDALHWFCEERFFEELDRVLRPGGVFAMLAHGFTLLPKKLAVLESRYREILAPFTDSRLKLLNEGYQTIILPYTEKVVEPCRLERNCTGYEYLQTMGTWSAAREYERIYKQSPLEQIREGWYGEWPSDERRTVTIPLIARVCVKEG